MGGHEGEIEMRVDGKKTTVKVDSSWVVPYNPVLLSTFQAHINVELCSSVKSIKYACKYVYKGPDAAMFALLDDQTNNEVTQYRMARYVSTSSALWGLWEFPLHASPVCGTLSCAP